MSRAHNLFYFTKMKINLIYSLFMRHDGKCDVILEKVLDFTFVTQQYNWRNKHCAHSLIQKLTSALWCNWINHSRGVLEFYPSNLTRWQERTNNYSFHPHFVSMEPAHNHTTDIWTTVIGFFPVNLNNSRNSLHPVFLIISYQTLNRYEVL